MNLTSKKVESSDDLALPKNKRMQSQVYSSNQKDAMGPTHEQLYGEVAVKILIENKNEIESSKGTGSEEQYY